jgi:hypothetical protein
MTSGSLDVAVGMALDAATPAGLSSPLKRPSADEPPDGAQEGDHLSKRIKTDEQPQAAQTTATNQQPIVLAPASAAAAPQFNAPISAVESKEIDLPPCARFPPHLFHAAPAQARRELYRDALQSVFELLQVEDVPLVMRISKEWSEAAAKMPSQGWIHTCSNERMLLPVVSSPLRKT